MGGALSIRTATNRPCGRWRASRVCAISSRRDPASLLQYFRLGDYPLNQRSNADPAIVTPLCFARHVSKHDEVSFGEQGISVREQGIFARKEGCNVIHR